MFSVSQQGLRGDELGGDPLCFVMEHLGVADLGRLGKTCRRLRDAVDESGFEHLRLVRKIRSARKDPAGNVYVCVYSKPVSCCFVPKSMPMTKSDVGREIARCAVGFLREHRNAWCVSVGNGETGRIEAIHMRNGGLDCPGGKGTYSYRIYTDDAGGFVLVPF